MDNNDSQAHKKHADPTSYYFPDPQASWGGTLLGAAAVGVTHPFQANSPTLFFPPLKLTPQLINVLASAFLKPTANTRSEILPETAVKVKTACYVNKTKHVWQPVMRAHRTSGMHRTRGRTHAMDRKSPVKRRFMGGNKKTKL